MNDLNDLARRYVAVWNEPDAAVRREMIAQLFAPGAAHYTPSMEAHGHAQMEARIATSYDKWVEPGAYVFRAVENATGHHDAVRFNWEMVRTASGEVDSVGFDFLTLGEDGRIRTDHQFIES
ncbi:nuclear transport factor 2 family protein [Microbispora bryophytorum]|uniref:nuclear transport factor 2 family protein n=1 Tax=Microbispora bryophytorum TaxID=1460882 RepID=UPI00340A4DAD